MKGEEEASLKSPLTSIFIASFWAGGVRMRPNTIQLGRGIDSSSLGAALALLVWLLSCMSYVAVERVDG